MDRLRLRLSHRPLSSAGSSETSSVFSLEPLIRRRHTTKTPRPRPPPPPFRLPDPGSTPADAYRHSFPAAAGFPAPGDVLGFRLGRGKSRPLSTTSTLTATELEDVKHRHRRTVVVPLYTDEADGLFGPLSSHPVSDPPGAPQRHSGDLSAHRSSTGTDIASLATLVDIACVGLLVPAASMGSVAGMLLAPVAGAVDAGAKRLSFLPDLSTAAGIAAAVVEGTDERCTCPACAESGGAVASVGHVTEHVVTPVDAVSPQHETADIVQAPVEPSGADVVHSVVEVTAQGTESVAAADEPSLSAAPTVQISRVITVDSKKLEKARSAKLKFSTRFMEKYRKFTTRFRSWVVPQEGIVAA